MMDCSRNDRRLVELGAERKPVCHVRPRDSVMSTGIMCIANWRISTTGKTNRQLHYIDRIQMQLIEFCNL